MPEVARYFMRFCMDESCGKCLPCRAGTYEMHELLEALIDGRGTPPRWRGSRPCATSCARTASAAWARPRPTRCCPPALLPPRVRGAAGAPGRDRPPPSPLRRARGAPDGRRQPEDRRRRGRGARRRDDHARRRARRRRVPGLCQFSTASPSSAPAGCAWSRWPARRGPAPPAPPRSPRRWTSTPTPRACASTAGCCCRCCSPRASTSAPPASPTAHCELQTLAAELGVDHVNFSPPAHRLTMDLSHPRFGYDPSRCVLCTRCVRACAEVEGAFTWGVAGRGRDTHLVADLGAPWGESGPPAPRAASA
jgi:hypothetical protein